MLTGCLHTGAAEFQLDADWPQEQEQMQEQWTRKSNLVTHREPVCREVPWIRSSKYDLSHVPEVTFRSLWAMSSTPEHGARNMQAFHEPARVNTRGCWYRKVPQQPRRRPSYLM